MAVTFVPFLKYEAMDDLPKSYTSLHPDRAESAGMLLIMLLMT